MAVKNIDPATPFNLAASIEYSAGSVVSKTFVSGNAGTVTVFAFDQGQGLSEHSAPFDALGYVLDGACRFTIGGKESITSAGEMILLPANIPHALQAPEKFKLLLVMIKEKAA